MCLQEDAQRDLDAATALEESNGAVEVDVVPKRELGSRGRRVSGDLEALTPPRFDLLELGRVLDLCRCHRLSTPYSYERPEWMLPSRDARNRRRVTLLAAIVTMRRESDARATGAVPDLTRALR